MDNSQDNKPVAWMIKFKSQEHPDFLEVHYHGTNAIADYLQIDPEATVTPLYTAAPRDEQVETYDLSAVIRLTHVKAKGIIEQRGYAVTGFVLTNAIGKKCIVDMSAVRWFHEDREFFELMQGANYLRDEVEALRRDAERYRMLKTGNYSVERFVSSSYGWKEIPDDRLDEVLDAARKGEE